MKTSPPRTIVIGASRGIGAAITKELEASGHVVIGMSRKTIPSLDLDAPQQVIERSMREAIETLGGLDNLVISGGMGAYLNPIASEKSIEELIHTNLIGPILAYQAALKALMQSKGSVLFLSSTCSGRPGASGLSVYASTKGGIESYVISEARRVARKGVRMNVLQPGWVESPMTEEIAPKLRERIIKAIPLKRMGTPEEMAHVAADIIEGPEFLTGSIIRVGGGA